jgi:outer membrane lipase/esterase
MFFSARAAAFAKLWLFSFVLTIGLLAPGLASADGRPFDRIVVFGDSLSDPGNAFALNGGIKVGPPSYGMVTPQDLLTLIPRAPYGSLRFSNGPTWIELLGTAIGLGSDVKAAFAENAGRRASNYAVGGARASDVSAEPNVSLSQQVGAFFGDVGRHLPRNALYVIAIGGNDIRDALNAFLETGEETAPAKVIEAALASLAPNIVTLHQDARAKKFLVWNAPDLSRTPAIQRSVALLCSGSPDLPTYLLCIRNLTNDVRDLSLAYNAGLTGLLDNLQLAFSEIEFIRFDGFGLLEPIQADPGRYGLTNAGDACIQPHVPELGVTSSPPHRCAEPDRFFFWDGIHPTRAGHAILAYLVGKAVVQALQDD